MINYLNLPDDIENIIQTLDRVCQGEEIVISHAGETIAHISPLHISPLQKDGEPELPGQYVEQYVEQYAEKSTIPIDFKDSLPNDGLNDCLNPIDPTLNE